MSDQVRDRRKAPYYRVEKIVYEDYANMIGVYGLAVYNALARYAGEDETCYPSIPLIAKKLGCSVRQVQRSIECLKGIGLIAVEPRFIEGKRTSNLYTLLDVSGVTHSHLPGDSESYKEALEEQESTATPFSPKFNDEA